ncbi:p-loop containing nucleoside triphosphate hydrolase protein [Mycena indigotica]|uniref:p-loop containing nucleoside triphosphate hydrolase protein n=1 Tax=Mycena indigotica TaxID=2126181 RepID=A0A8H6VWZ0_9AGAR|nr:p-loop containing nucleoside triphosphate hydrolase protein [Mycena indigotica]KAF7291234.1 p-loop containing nucleoside triphosphate hydrolase protein [Mycena indigotica]
MTLWRAAGRFPFNPISSSRRCYTSPFILALPKADIYRFGDANRATPVLHSVEWTIEPHESWAVVGSGSGEKSLIFDLLTGHLRVHPPPGQLYPFLAANGDPYSCISLVSFANRRAAGGAFYDFSARYGAVREEDRYTLRQTMFPETIHDLKAHTRVALEEKSTMDMALFDELVDKLQLRDLMDLPRVVLSNGQTRRARILKALLGKPRLLLLDEPLTGLDAANRSTVLSILHHLHQKNDPHILLGLRSQDSVPGWITHLALVDNGAVHVGPKASMLPHKTRMQEAAARRAESRISPTQTGDVVVEMKDVNVAYGPRQVLKNINWTIRQGERYHLRGTNGSGKTTLLALLTGDHPQSYTQRSNSSSFSLFGSPRHKLPTPTIHSRIGVLTPELFDAFPRRSPGMTVWEVIGTGFDGGYVSRGEDGVGGAEEERSWRVDRINAVLDALGPAAWSVSPIPASEFAKRRLVSLPVGEQRIVLLMRALVARHPLILLDEVWSGMDGQMVRAAHDYLRGGGVGDHQAVVVVTHIEDEVPWDERDGLRRVELQDGVLRFCG